MHFTVMAVVQQRYYYDCPGQNCYIETIGQPLDTCTESNIRFKSRLVDPTRGGRVAVVMQEITLAVYMAAKDRFCDWLLAVIAVNEGKGKN